MRALLRTALAVIALLALPEASRADLGALVADGTAGPYRVSVLVAPTPLRVGRSRWSVLVQDASGGAVEDAEVTLSWTAEGNGARHVERAAREDAEVTPSRNAAGHGAHHVERAARPGVHPFYLSSEADLPTATRWRVAARVRGPKGTGALAFDALVSPGLGTWRTHWPALLTPFLALGLFALHQSLRQRARRTGT